MGALLRGLPLGFTHRLLISGAVMGSLRQNRGIGDPLPSALQLSASWRNDRRIRLSHPTTEQQGPVTVAESQAATDEQERW
ncbi:hypothetical protein AZG88_48090 [Rhodococcus sp. LB1]|nr:hypothetical protein AZG88_48090 [Rhodococcus sp. LB1]